MSPRERLMAAAIIIRDAVEEQDAISATSGAREDSAEHFAERAA
jgi:hypothetical protein